MACALTIGRPHVAITVLAGDAGDGSSKNSQTADSVQEVVIHAANGCSFARGGEVGVFSMLGWRSVGRYAAC